MEMNQVHVSKIAFREVLQAAFRYKWKMLMFFTVVSSAVIAWVYMSPKVYQSEARLQVRPGRQYVQKDMSALDSAKSPGPTFGQLLTSEVSVLMGRRLAENVVATLGPEVVLNMPHVAPAPSTEAQAPDKLKKLAEDQDTNIRNGAIRSIVNGLQAVSKGNTISLTFNSQDPDSAQQILNAILSEYLARHIEIHETQSSLKFMRTRLAELSEELQASETALAGFRDEHRLVALEAEKQSIILAIRALGAEVGNTRALEESIEKQLVVLHEAIAGRTEMVEISSVSGTVNPVSAFLRQQLLQLGLEERDLQALYPDTHRPLMDVRSKIASVQADLENEPATTDSKTIAIDESYKSLQIRIDEAQVDLAGYRAMRNSKEGELANLREDARGLAGHELTLSRLRRDLTIREQEYIQYKSGFSRAEANAALDRAQLSNVIVTQEATLPVAPIKPRKTRNVALGLVLGLLGAIALGCFLDYADDTLKSQSDVERYLEIPVLAIVSEEEFRSCI